MNDSTSTFPDLPDAGDIEGCKVQPVSSTDTSSEDFESINKLSGILEAATKNSYIDSFVQSEMVESPDPSHKRVFITGFPGFIASLLVEELLNQYPETVTFECLVQSHFREVAESKAKELDGADRIRIHCGDITTEGLGLDEQLCSALFPYTTAIFHLAAVYELSMARELGMKVNVEGTKNMLTFAKKCQNLKAFNYISTCYVSGTYSGRFMEEDLEKGQGFNNFYEETKYLAEVEVNKYRKDGTIPITIYRPAVVVGDSITGETQKYDGPYSIIAWCQRWWKIAPLPVVMGRAYQTYVNIVPRDFVVSSILYLSSIEKSAGKVYALADPNPLTVSALASLICRTVHVSILQIPLPHWLVKTALNHVPGLERWTGFSPSIVDYFKSETVYDTTNTVNDLSPDETNPGGTQCPPVKSYIQKLVDYMDQHPEHSTTGMK